MIGRLLAIPSLEPLLPAIFVAAVADHPIEVAGLPEDALDGFHVFGVQLDAEHPDILIDVFGYP